MTRADIASGDKNVSWWVDGQTIRLVLAGAAPAPHVWYMSRQNDELDWDYFLETAIRAKKQADIEDRNFSYDMPK